MIYAAACAITEKIGKKIINRQQKQRKQPFWKVKIEKEINVLTRDLSMLTELTEDSGMGGRKRKKIKGKYVIKSDDDITTAKEKVRQLIQAKAQRV